MYSRKVANVLFSLWRKARFSAQAVTGFVFWGGLLFVLEGCAIPQLDPSTKAGLEAIKVEVNRALTSKNCSRAVEVIEQAYYSPYVDNEVRLLMAAAHGCRAQIEFFPFFLDLADADLVGAGFWESMSRLFYATNSDLLDSRLESSKLATRALLAALKSGSVIPVQDQVVDDEDNLGSTNVADRVDDANLYLIMIAMSEIGATQARYGDPDPANNYRKQTPLPWASVADIRGDTANAACAYASSILNVIDAIGAVSNQISYGVGSSLNDFRGTFQGQIDSACQAGCSGVDPVCAAAGLGPTDCTPCPRVLRDPEQCATSDAAACSALGIIDFINTSPLGWQDV